jgi:hypothetical protein
MPSIDVSAARMVGFRFGFQPQDRCNIGLSGSCFRLSPRPECRDLVPTAWRSTDEMATGGYRYNEIPGGARSSFEWISGDRLWFMLIASSAGFPRR